MSEISSAAVPAPEAPAAEEEQDPFAGFTTEAFERGERVDEESDAEGPDSAGEANPVVDTGEAEAGTAPRKPQTAQERINELTRARRQAEREADDLRKRLEDLEQQRLPKEEPATKVETPAPAERTVPKGPPSPSDFEFGELDSAYIAAVVDYHADLRFEEFRRAQQEEKQQAELAARHSTAHTKFQQQVELGKKKYADFEERVVKGAQDGAWPLSETLGVLMVESDVGEDIAYHLASNPDEALSVDRLPPVEQARYFGRLEAKFSAARAAAPDGDSSVEKPAVSRAPQAPAPIGTARGAGGRFQATAATDDFLAFEAAANGK